MSNRKDEQQGRRLPKALSGGTAAKRWDSKPLTRCREDERRPKGRSHARLYVQVLRQRMLDKERIEEAIQEVCCAPLVAAGQAQPQPASQWWTPALASLRLSAMRGVMSCVPQSIHEVVPRMVGNAVREHAPAAVNAQASDARPCAGHECRSCGPAVPAAHTACGL